MPTPHPPAPGRRQPTGCGAAAGVNIRVGPSALAVPLLLLVLAFPQDAFAHGIVGRADLPIPAWLFSWAAAAVLVVSFAALAALWPAPRLQHERLLGALPIPKWVPALLSLLGLTLFGLVLYSGFAGAQVPAANFSVTFVYVAFWVGMPLLSVLAGDVFQVISPGGRWRAS